MEEIEKALRQSPIVYVTRDIERAIGMDLNNPNFYIISNSSAFAKSLATDRTQIVLIKEDRLLDTHELLERASEKNLMKSFGLTSKPNILVFKNTDLIERICRENGWNLLNPSAELASRVEEKISQVAWLGEASKYLPKHEIKLCKEVEWPDHPFILQFNRSHTGQGTILVEKRQELEAIQSKFQNRPVRISEYVEGHTLTINNIVTKDGVVIMGNPSYQITGIAPFSFQNFATIGNDWALGHWLLETGNIKEEIRKISREIAKRLHQEGWCGLFGLDFVIDEKTNRIYLLEINMRQPASTSFESKLQDKTRQAKSDTQNCSMTVFELHILSLLGEPISQISGSIPIQDGAQIILRKSDQNISAEQNLEQLAAELESMGLNTIAYERSKTGAELLRIQSQKGIMEAHNHFNEVGKEIQGIIESCINKKNTEHSNTNHAGFQKQSLQEKIPGRNQTTEVRHSAETSTSKTKIQQSETLSKQALRLIEQYEHLKWGEKKIPCPYINNKRTKLRAALSVMIGKGSPTEIIEEAEVLALQKGISLTKLEAEQVKQFLVDNGLGVDCSGFAYHLLEEESAARGKTKLKKQIELPASRNPLRNLIKKFRHIENTNVEAFSDPKNSIEILLSEVKPGDMIVILKSGTDQMRDHIALISKVNYADGIPLSLEYAHAQRWGSDGRYDHGVRRGIINIQDITKNLLEQTWIEKNLSGNENETLQRAKKAKHLSIRRLRNF